MKKTAFSLLLSFLLLSTTMSISSPTYAHAGNLKQPNLSIDKKGKVSIVDEKTKNVKKKSTLVNELIKKYRVVIAGVSGIGAVSMILFFIINFMKLGALSTSEPYIRRNAIIGLALSGIAAAGLGSVSIIVGLFFNSLN